MVSDFGAYKELSLIERIEYACYARWPFLLAGVLAFGLLVVSAFA